MEIASEENNGGVLGRDIVPKENVSNIGGEQAESDDEDEDEDIDFNPFLQQTPSPEVSSSLSSENEGGLDIEGKDQPEGAVCDENDNAWLELGSEVEEDELAGNEEYEEEDVDEDDNGEDDIEDGIDKQKGENHLECSTGPERVEMLNIPLHECSGQAEICTQQCQISEGTDKNSCSASGPDERAHKLTDKAEEEMLGQTMDALPDLKTPRKSTIERQRGQSNDEEVEDAICKRTRAHYSLADLSLDELEMFLQESDEDDYFQNVDDEEEYRKFLAAVAGKLEGNGHDQEAQNKEDEDDEDEDNDADFEIEIEEALESDYDDTAEGKGRKRKHWGTGRRPETREKRRQRAYIQNKERLLGLAKTPLRPLLPSTSNLHTQSFPVQGQGFINAQHSHNRSNIENGDLINGFTAHQIGQLHCLIYEHVQLLIQVLSLCILEPSRQQIATETQRMLTELVDRRDQVLSWKKTPFPEFCFHPPYIHPSVSQYLQCSSHANDNTSWQSSVAGIPPVGTCSEQPVIGTGDPFPSRIDSGWVPLISGPVWSVLDAAPVGIIREFLADIAIVVREYRQRHVEIGEYHSQCEREPLFPLPSIDSGAQAQKKSVRGVVPLGPNVVSSAQPQQKKTMAAALVESTKRQSVALVPKDVVKIVQRFFPIFNPALFPHKAPPAATANRVLFTDAEDELLAMGLMTYNNDWKAIQQRFLPCKSMHQIFVRQKNRSSARAPDNSIKAVRRMKASPLTSEERACIHEGLRVLKFDWAKVWKYCVPYRDPALLSRQWRIALGTQKSYKTDDATKERRRLYEARRRRSKAGRKDCGSAVESEGVQGQQFENDDGEENSGDDNMEDADEAYVHEAFLADWKPCSSRFMAAALPASPVFSGNGSSSASNNLGIQSGRGYCEQTGTMQLHDLRLSTTDSQSLHQNMCFPSSRLDNISQIPYTSQVASAVTAGLQSAPLASFDYQRRPIRTQVNIRPYRSRKKAAVQTVKLAPDLPTLNLPPSVRVIPQSMLMSYQSAPSDRFPLAQNKKPNPPSLVPVTLDPQCHLQSSKYGIDGTVVKPDSSTVPMATVMSTSTVELDRNLSTKPSIHLSNHNHGKDMSLTWQKPLPVIIQEQPSPPDGQKDSEKDIEPKSKESGHESDEADLDMHPLLLQNSHKGSAQYQCNKYASGVQVPFNILSVNPQHSDFRPFFSPPRGISASGHQVMVSMVPPRKGVVSTSSATDFHPLLQRNPEVTATSSTACPYQPLHYDHISGAIESNSTQSWPSMCVSTPGAGPTELLEKNQIHQTNSTIPFAANDVSELHSEKHASTCNDKRPAIVEGNHRSEQEVAEGGTDRVLERKNTVRRRKQAKGQTALQQGLCNTARKRKSEATSHMQGSRTISDKAALSTHLGVESQNKSDPNILMDKNQAITVGDFITSRQSGKEQNESSVACLKDDSLPEIVMEREELSDSEDEIGENVQFECEEIGDSDGEDSGYSQHKEECSIEFEEEEIISENDLTEDECRLGNSVSNSVAGVNQDIVSVSVPVLMGKKQNSVRKRSTRSHCPVSVIDSIDIKSTKQKQSSKRPTTRSHGETARSGYARSKQKRTKEMQETNDMNIENLVAIGAQEVNLGTVDVLSEGSTQQSPVNCLYKGRRPKSLGKVSQHVNTDGDNVSDACENQTMSRRHAHDCGFPHSKTGMAGTEERVYDSETSICQDVRGTDVIAIEAAQVLTVIHQRPIGNKKGSYVG